MNQAEESIRRERADDGKKKLLLYRRIGAGVLVALAIALGVFLHTIDLSVGKLMWGVALALMLIEALLLAVNLKVSRALQAVLGVLCIALLCMGFLKQYYVLVGNRFVPKYKVITRLTVDEEYPKHFTEMESLQDLNMRASTIEDFEPIRALKALQKLDIRENYAFDQAEHDALAAALPDCDIRWSVPVKKIHFDSAAEEVDLRQVELTRDELRAMFAAYPDKRFAYRVPLLGGRYAPDVTELDLKGCDVDAPAIEDALMLLPHVTRIDLRGTPASAQDVGYLTAAFPDVNFSFTFDVPQSAMTTEDTWVKVTGSYETLAAYVDFIDYMPRLELVDAGEIELTGEQVDAVKAHKNGDKVRYGMDAFGRKVTSDVTELNLDGAPVTDVEAVEACLARLPNVKKVSLLDCGLSQDQCGQLFDAHPEIKFVFWITFGKYRIRTDVTAFSTQLGDGNRYGFNDKTFEPIRYCTDLMMLDLGHNHITSMENFSGLTKLRVLILADNQLTDIAPIANFKDLEFCELFLNDIPDMSPLTGLEKLVDLNIFYNPVGQNYQALKSMTQLKRLWIGGCRLSGAMLKDLQRALPNTKINAEGRGSTGMGWRKHPHYDTLKQMYLEERYIPFDDSPTDEAQAQAD